VGKLKRLAGETVLYGLGSILPRFLNFLLVYLHTSVFGALAYGIFTLLFAWVAVFNVIFSFGMETTYFRFANKPGANEKQVFNVTQTVVVAISGFFSILFLFNLDNIVTALDIGGQRHVVIYIVILMFIDNIVSIPFARLRYKQQPIRFAVYKITNIVLLVGLNVYLLLFAGLEPEVGFIFLANLIANAFYILFFIPSLTSWRPAYDKQISPQVLKYSYPIMLTGIAGMMNENLSRITLERWLPENFYKDSKAALGIFGANYKFAVLMNLAIQAFRYAAEPFFFAQSSEKNSPQLFARINHYFVVVCCFILLAVSINLDVLKYFLGQPEYWSGLHIVPILLLAYLFLGIYYNYSVWFKVTDKTHWGTIITIVGLVITIGGNYILIPMLGYLGSAYAALACYLVMMMLCYVVGQRYFPVPYTIFKDFGYIVVTTLLVYLVYRLDGVINESQLIETVFHLAVLGLFVAIVVLIERKEFRKQA